MVDYELLKTIPISTTNYKLNSDGVVHDVDVVRPTNRIEIDNAYYKYPLKGTFKNVYLRKNLIDKLEKIISLLPSNYSFKIFDGFRTLETQKAIFHEFLVKIKEEEKLTEEEAFKKTLLFVPYPGEPGCYEVMPHNSGGAVDLTILCDGKPLDMGTDFDDTSDFAKTEFFESDFDEKYGYSSDRWVNVRDNRRLLFNLMIDQGFTNHPYEWWHYNFGNHPWAEELKTGSIYDSAEEKVLNIEKSLP